MEEFNDTINLGEDVVKVLKGIFDPEIPVDIYELGLIYDVMINEDNDVKILMTLSFRRREKKKRRQKSLQWLKSLLQLSKINPLQYI